MLTLTREQGQSIYLGRFLDIGNLEGTFDYRIDFDVVDHRVGCRRIEVAIIGRHDIQCAKLTPLKPDFDFAPDCRLAFLKTYEFLRDQEIQAAARVGIDAPRDMKIIRDNARAAVARNGGVR